MSNQQQAGDEARRRFDAFQTAAEPLLHQAMERLAAELMPLIRKHGVVPALELRVRPPTIDEWELCMEQDPERDLENVDIDYREARRRGRQRIAALDQTVRLN